MSCECARRLLAALALCAHAACVRSSGFEVPGIEGDGATLDGNAVALDAVSALRKQGGPYADGRVLQLHARVADFDLHVELPELLPEGPTTITAFGAVHVFALDGPDSDVRTDAVAGTITVTGGTAIGDEIRAELIDVELRDVCGGAPRTLQRARFGARIEEANNLTGIGIGGHAILEMDEGDGLRTLPRVVAAYTRTNGQMTLVLPDACLLREDERTRLVQIDFFPARVGADGFMDLAQESGAMAFGFARVTPEGTGDGIAKATAGVVFFDGVPSSDDEATWEMHFEDVVLHYDTRPELQDVSIPAADLSVVMERPVELVALATR